jgi:hypothetical protein
MTLAYVLFRRRIILPIIWGSARVLRAEVTGRTQAVQAPLTPQPRGTIIEALPFILVLDSMDIQEK